MFSFANPPDQVTVWLDVEATDSRGNIARKPGSESVSLRMFSEPLNASESSADGEQVVTEYRLIGSSFPGGPWAKVDYLGREWDVSGEPERYNGYSGTEVVAVRIRARGPAQVPSG